MKKMEEKENVAQLSALMNEFLNELKEVLAIVPPEVMEEPVTRKEIEAMMDEQFKKMDQVISQSTQRVEKLPEATEEAKAGVLRTLFDTLGSILADFKEGIKQSLANAKYQAVERTKDRLDDTRLGFKNGINSRVLAVNDKLKKLGESIDRRFAIEEKTRGVVTPSAEKETVQDEEKEEKKESEQKEVVPSQKEKFQIYLNERKLVDELTEQMTQAFKENQLPSEETQEALAQHQEAMKNVLEELSPETLATYVEHLSEREKAQVEQLAETEERLETLQEEQKQLVSGGSFLRDKGDGTEPTSLEKFQALEAKINEAKDELEGLRHELSVSQFEIEAATQLQAAMTKEKDVTPPVVEQPKKVEAVEQLERKVKQPIEQKPIDAPTLTFEGIVQNAFDEGVGKHPEQWTTIEEIQQAFDQFYEDVQAKIEEAITPEMKEKGETWQEEFQEYFYEGGKEAVDLSYANGTDLLLKESTLSEFADKFEQLVKPDQQVTQSAPEEIVAPVQTKVQEYVAEKKMDELASQLKENMTNYLDPEQFKKYMNFLSGNHFHQYSQRNSQLLFEQDPNVNQVASANKWKQLGYELKENPTPLYVYQPTKEKQLDEAGNVVTNDKGEPVERLDFHLTPVFDVSQTTQGELIQPRVREAVAELSENEKFTKLSAVLKEVSPVELTIQPMKGEPTVYDSEKKLISIEQGLGTEGTLKAMVQEILVVNQTLEKKKSTEADSSHRGFELEAATQVVSNYIGLSTSTNFEETLNNWSKTSSGADLGKSLEAITKQAQSLIKQIDQSSEKILQKEQPKNKFESRVKEAREKQQVTQSSEKAVEATPDPKVESPVKAR
jgi:hypothetical protein